MLDDRRFNNVGIVSSANMAYVIADWQEMRLAQGVGADLAIGGVNDPPDQLRPRTPPAVDEPIDGGVRDAGRDGKSAEGNVVSLAVARERVHAGKLPKRQEERKRYPATPAVVAFRPIRQDAGMPRGRRKILPIAEDNRVYVLRTARGWTQEELAERMGVAGTTVQRAESGQRGLSKSVRAKLAKVFGVAQSELFAQPARFATEHEEEAAQLARHLTPEEREIWLQTGRALARRVSKNNNVA